MRTLEGWTVFFRNRYSADQAVHEIGPYTNIPQLPVNSEINWKGNHGYVKNVAFDFATHSVVYDIQWLTN